MSLASFLVDTDWVIDHFNRIAPVTRRLQELRKEGLALSIISVAELWEGVYYSTDPVRSQAMLKEFLAGIVVLGIDEEICKRFGELRGSLRRGGKLVGDFDLLIAASALRHNLTLVTNNRRHFETIEELRIESISG
jgi:tRNA(fMet)-specific endonuclease VapC